MRTVNLNMDLVLERGADEDEVAKRVNRAVSETIGALQGVEAVGEVRPTPHRFKWILEIEVDRTWVADGFNMTDQRAQDMLSEHLSYAHQSEIGARVLSAPDPRDIRSAQGYQDEDDE